MMKSSLRKKIIYRVFLGIFLVGGIWVLVRLSPVLTRPEYIPGDDFFQFWVGGSQNLHGFDPYNPQVIEQMRSQASGNPAHTEIAIMLNPPWVVSIFMFLGLLTYPVSRLIWLLISIIIILSSVQILWRIYSGDPKKRWQGILAVFIFASTISVLEKGQLAVFVLLGLAGFLYFIQIKRMDWLAGIGLSLMTFKPQIAILVWIVLLLWIIQQRRWLILLSAILTTLILSLIAVVFNPHIFMQYVTMLQTYNISGWATPTIGAYLRFFWLGIDKFWLQFLPTLFGAVWSIYYWHKHHKGWNWNNELPLLLFVSIIISPYIWTYDQVILIPAIIPAVVWIATNWKRGSALVFTISYLALNLLNLFLHTKLDEFWFIWFAPALFILYMVIRFQLSTSPQNPKIVRQTVG